MMKFSAALIHRRTLRLGIALLSVLMAVQATRAYNGSQPNIILVFTDDMGYGDLGVFHQNDRVGKRHATPNLDRFAREGVQLRRHYCPAPVCAPSRASLLRGLHQGHTEVRNSDFDKAIPDNHTLGTVLQGAGYRTLHVGKYGLQGLGPEGELGNSYANQKAYNNPAEWPAYPTKRGFDEYFGYVRHVDGHVHYPNNEWPIGNSESHRTGKEVWHNNEEVSASLDKCYTTDLFTAFAKKWIVDHRKENADQPFFIYLAYDTPHAALQVPTQAYPEGSGLDGGLQWVGEHGRMINTASGEIDSWIHPDYRNPEWSNVERRFATMVRRIDSCVGDLTHLLEDLGIEEDTLVVFTNDNGPLAVSYIEGEPFTPIHFQSYGPFDGEKRDVWEGGIRMPSLARWPGTILEGTIDQTPSQFHDWMATFAELAGVPMPALSDGVSLIPSITASGERQPSSVYVEFKHGRRTPNYADFHPSHRNRPRGEMQAIFMEGYKGVRVDIKSHADAFEIFDVTTDLKETRNLAGTSEYFVGLEQRMRDRTLQMRRPNADNPRPYDGELVPPVGLEATRPGLSWKAYTGSFPWVPKFWSKKPDYVGTATGLNVDLGPNKGAIVYSGYIEAPEDGEYLLYLDSSARAIVRLHEALLIDADYGYEGGEIASRIALKSGWHPITVHLLKSAGEEPKLDIEWSGPSFARKALATESLVH